MILKNPVLMAQIGGPHGIKGELRVKPFCDDPLALDAYGSLYSDDGQKFRIMRLRAAKDVLVVKFKGINYRDEAQALNGVKLYVDRSMLPDDTEEDEFYITDLIGCEIVDEEGNLIGSVLAVPNFGAGDLIEVGFAGSSRTGFVEFTRNNVPALDLEAGQITMRLPQEVSERDD